MTGSAAWGRLVICGVVLTVVSGCATRRPGPRVTPDPPSSASEVTDVGEAIVLTALDLRGTPYRNGGDTPRGFDCSGFTRYVFARHGIDLPRRAFDQYSTGVPVERDSLAPGDLVFFATVAKGASHVGVSTGNGEFVHAPSRRGRVRVERLESPYWTRRYLGARRLRPR